MNSKISHSNWDIQNHQSIFFTLFTITAGMFNGIAFTIWNSNSAFYIANGYLKFWQLGIIPVAGLIWGIFHSKFKSFHLNVIILALSLITYSFWVIKTPSFNAIGDLISNPRNMLSILVWFFLLCSLMSIIDFLVGSQNLPFILVAILIAFYSYLRIPMINTSDYAGSKVGVWINGIFLLLLCGSIWAATVEGVLLLCWELTLKNFTKEEKR